jgi:CHAT domain-containing protein/Tfp pilus assembly protein PilF
MKEDTRMSSTSFHRRRLPINCWLKVALCLILCLPYPARSQTSDEAALRVLAEQFFAVYESRDLDGLMRLWSEKSPELASGKKSFQQIFGANKIELKRLTVRQVSVENDRARVRVTVEQSLVDAATGAPAKGPGKLNRTLHCVKEGEKWTVWRYESGEEEMAAALASARTDDERKKLLEAENELAPAELAQALLAQGRRLHTQSKYAQAMAIYELAMEMAERSGDKKAVAGALRGIGTVHLLKGDYAHALERLQESLSLSEGIGDRDGIARALVNIGILRQRQGDYAKSLESHKKGLNLMEELGDKPGIVAALNNMGIVHQLMGNYARALVSFETGLKLTEATGNEYLISDLLNSIGTVHWSQGAYAQALGYFQKRLPLAEKIGDKAGVASTLSNMGVIYEAQGDYTKAMDLYQKSLKSSEEVGDRHGVAVRLNNIGGVHSSLGNYALGLEAHRKSLQIYEEIGARDFAAATLMNIGNVHHRQGAYAQALEHYQKSLKISEDIGKQAEMTTAWSNIGDVHYAQGNYKQAMEHYQKSLKIGVKIGDKRKIARSLNQIGAVHRSEGDYDRAVESANRAAVIARQIGAPGLVWDIQTTLGRAYRALNRPEQARQALSVAIDAVEELRAQVAGDASERQRFFETRTAPYDEMIHLLLDQRDLREAFNYAERAKGRALLDVLQAGRVDITKAMTADEQAQERRLNGEVISLGAQIHREKLREQPDQAGLAQLEADLSKARLAYESFQINLYAAHPELRTQRGRLQLITLDQAGALISDTNTAVLEFVVTHDKTYLFVLTNKKGTGPRAKASGLTPNLSVYTINLKREELSDRVERFRRRLANLDFDFQPLARELYDLLIGPARAELRGKTNLVIVTDGPLWEAPFQALQSASGRYLIEDAALSYAPSLTALREMSGGRAADNKSATTLLAFGNPAAGEQTTARVRAVFMKERLDPLPEAERQVKELGRLYAPSRSKVYVGAEANEGRAKAEAERYSLLHFAAHGILNDANPMYSQIVLTQPEGDDREDGMLEAWEIMRLNLKADLVVLSACETARGRVGNGEGMIGLVWAFFVAGAPATVASQWQVEARSTTGLMLEFHRQLRRGKGKAQALRQAAMNLRKLEEYQHPFYWAGFVVVGNGR